MASKEYNGHKSYNHWNVYLWLFNEEPLYRMVVDICESEDTLEDAVSMLMENIEGSSTGDGVKYTKTTVREAIREEYKERKKSKNS